MGAYMEVGNDDHREVGGRVVPGAATESNAGVVAEGSEIFDIYVENLSKRSTFRRNDNLFSVS